MRFGVVIVGDDWLGIRREAELLEAAGVDCCLLRAGGYTRSSTAVAAALAAVTTDLRVLVEVEAGSHPVGLAEELTVCDLLLGGRLVAVVTGDEIDVVEETLDVLANVFARRRFRHDGRHWQFPTARTDTIMVTPAPAQFALPVWVGGASLESLAGRRDLTWLAPTSRVEETRASVAVARVRLTDNGDFEDTVGELSRLQRNAPLGLCILDLLERAEARPDAIRLVGSRLRPRLQGNDLPPDLVSFWG